MLLCSDLDGTLIPDGRVPEPANARVQFRRYVVDNDIRVVYATGRSVEHADAGIIYADLPLGWALIADAGASLYYRDMWGWQPWTGYEELIKPQWTPDDICALLDGVPGVAPQEESRQTEFKVSFYCTSHYAKDEIAARLVDVECTELWSSDGDVGWLFDVLPLNASKRHALLYAADEPGIVFAGNDGNDLPILGSDIRSVLVANADWLTRAAAKVNARTSGHEDRLYLASQPYAAGVLEGLQHFMGVS